MLNIEKPLTPSLYLERTKVLISVPDILRMTSSAKQLIKL